MQKGSGLQPRAQSPGSSDLLGFFISPKSCSPMSIYDQLSDHEYRIEDDPEGPTLRMYKPDKDGHLERVNAFIRPDKALVEKRGVEISPGSICRTRTGRG